MDRFSIRHEATQADFGNKNLSIVVSIQKVTRANDENADSKTLLDIPASASRVDSFWFLNHCWRI